MDINTKLSEQLFPNESEFSSDFFNRFSLKSTETPLVLNEGITKQYKFPTFYGDASCSIAIFHCDYAAAKKMMPHSSMAPVKMTKGRSLVIFSCYEYRNVMNLKPYNEIAMTIPVIRDGGTNIPVLSMLLGDKSRKFGYYVFHMPVTSLENRIRGREMWGLPKEVEQVEIKQANDFSFIRASEPGLKPYLQLKIPTNGTAQDFDVRSNLYSVLNGERLKSTTHFKGTFNINKHLGSIISTSSVGDNDTLTLGSGPVADKLRALKIEQQIFQSRYCDSMDACFDLPHERESI